MAEQKPIKLVVGTPNTLQEMNSAAGDTLQEALLPSTVVKTTATQTLSGKTLTAPDINKVEKKGAVTNTVAAFATTSVASSGDAVDHVQLTSRPTGSSAAIIAANSGATDVSIDLIPKGSGSVLANGSALVTATGSATLTNKTLTAPTITSPSISAGQWGSANHNHSDAANGGGIAGIALTSAVRGKYLSNESGTSPSSPTTLSSFRTASGVGTDHFVNMVSAVTHDESGDSTGLAAGFPVLSTRSRVAYHNLVGPAASILGVTGYMNWGSLWRVGGPASAVDAEQAGHLTNWRRASSVYDMQSFATNALGSSAVAADRGKVFEMELSAKLVTTVASTYTLGYIGPNNGTTYQSIGTTASLAAGTYNFHARAIWTCYAVSSTTASTSMYVTEAWVQTAAGTVVNLGLGPFAQASGTITIDGTVRYLSLGLSITTAQTGAPTVDAILIGRELS